MKNDKGAIIVTGGSRGIGRAISIALAAEEFSVVINYLDNEEAATNVKQEIISKERQAITIQADITNSDEVQKMVVQ